MSFLPCQIKITYNNQTEDAFSIDLQKNEYIGNQATISFAADQEGIYAPVIKALTNIHPVAAEILFKIPEGALGDDLYYYYAALTTNDVTSVFKHSEHPNTHAKDFFVAKNKATNEHFNIGILTAHKLYTSIRMYNDVVTVHYDLEERLIEAGRELTLEKFICGDEDEVTFLKQRYAPLVARENNAIPLAKIPVGWCSWSCYYRNVDEAKITAAAEDMEQLVTGADLVQIDDGWQVDGSFSGGWQINAEKFPNGLDSLIKDCNEHGITFGLWLSPFLISENSVFYKELKHLVIQDRVTHPGKVHPFDLDNPIFYEYLYNTYHYLSHELGVKYYKLDFMIMGYRSYVEDEETRQKGNLLRYKSDYRSALFRKVIQTIREAVGKDAILLSCGSPIIECAGIFDAQRISRDIIVPKCDGDPFYWQHWSNMKNASKSILYRYFYNNVVFRNDPDGAVLRDYDVGDGFDCTYAEAQYWSTIVALSGGLVLANDEFRMLSKPRQRLFTHLLPPLGISGRAVDMFEYPAPTKAIIDADENTKYIAQFNLSDRFENTEVRLRDYDIEGEKLIFDCWESTFLGKTDRISRKLVNPHSAQMYMVKELPQMPTFLYSNINLYLGYNVFEASFDGSKLAITVKRDCEKYLTKETKIFAYYPKVFEGCIGEHEQICCSTEEYCITEYKF